MDFVKITSDTTFRERTNRRPSLLLRVKERFRRIKRERQTREK